MKPDKAYYAEWEFKEPLASTGTARHECGAAQERGKPACSVAPNRVRMILRGKLPESRARCAKPAAVRPRNRASAKCPNKNACQESRSKKPPPPARAVKGRGCPPDATGARAERQGPAHGVYAGPQRMRKNKPALNDAVPLGARRLLPARCCCEVGTRLAPLESKRACTEDIRKTAATSSSRLSSSSAVLPQASSCCMTSLSTCVRPFISVLDHAVLDMCHFFSAIVAHLVLDEGRGGDARG